MKTNVSLCIVAALMVAACGDPSHRHNSGEKVSVINSTPDEVTPDEVIEEDVEITANEAALMEPSANATSKMILSSPPQQRNAETYKEIKENSFVAVAQQPVTTFSADVDRAAYANVRRIIGYGQIPPKDAVRIEEMVNYFDYDYPAPEEGSASPLRVSPELAPAPWNPNHLLLRIGLQAKKIDLAKAPPSNIVFLIDVSGSMDEENKLPLLQSSFKMLLGQLRPDDKVAIVTYANGTKVALPSTSVKDKEKIIKVLDNLYASGGTSGGKGIQLAYEQAQKSFIKNGNNRIILATDGDFNIGINNTTDLEKFIEKQRESGIYMSVLGFGMGNYRDDMAETIADKGNGNYAYIDNITEAKKVLVNELSGTLFAVAKDVKLQLEFNPKYVKEYKLIGYENRMLANEDFTNDKKDAGEIGAGHTVTALYELVPSDGKVAQSLRYQSQELNEKGKGNELGFLKIRYKDPKVKDAKSVEITEPLIFNKKALKETSTDYRFAASVAEFGILLRDNSNKANATYDQVIELAEGAIGKDPEGYRKEFVRLVKSVKMLPK
ncbi:VWA domain-containing protein [Capnocytophaga leadbetteri]|uniref:vWA domain-containing protein n=1 Tax=Capnocytophaga leadbetteri TaxID=327575 RepID=UPI0028D66EC4|nr:VWA domain-containing protein [Capnocytophaga leadbetteri]